jgi:hypothetical protein
MFVSFACGFDRSRADSQKKATTDCQISGGHRQSLWLDGFMSTSSSSRSSASKTRSPFMNRFTAATTKTGVLLATLALFASAVTSACRDESPTPREEARTASQASTSGVDLWSTGFGDADAGSGAGFGSSLRLGDINGDHRADVCGRSSDGIFCALSTGASFSAPSAPILWSAANDYTDALGWGAPNHANTIQLGDIDRDGKDDICARGVLGIYCSRSFGKGFGSADLWSNVFSDSNHWGLAPYANTIRLGDVDGDGYADVCGRGMKGIWCALSEWKLGNVASFGVPTLWNDAYSDANGWANPIYTDTIQLGDVNGDGRRDVCGRGSAGIWCALSSFTKFDSPTLWSNAFSDFLGWNQIEFANTIRLGDVDGDHVADVCGRGPAGLVCRLSDKKSFAATYGDANDRAGLPYANGIQLADIDGDGLGDLCGRGNTAVLCALPGPTATPPPPPVNFCKTEPANAPTFVRLPIALDPHYAYPPNGGDGFTVAFPTPWLTMDGGAPNQEPDVFAYERLLLGAFQTPAPPRYEYLVKKVTLGGSSPKRIAFVDPHMFFLVGYDPPSFNAQSAELDVVWNVARQHQYATSPRIDSRVFQCVTVVDVVNPNANPQGQPIKGTVATFAFAEVHDPGGDTCGGCGKTVLDANPATCPAAGDDGAPCLP